MAAVDRSYGGRFNRLERQCPVAVWPKIAFKPASVHPQTWWSTQNHHLSIVESWFSIEESSFMYKNGPSTPVFCSAFRCQSWEVRLNTFHELRHKQSVRTNAVSYHIVGDHITLWGDYLCSYSAPPQRSLHPFDSDVCRQKKPKAVVKQSKTIKINRKSHHAHRLARGRVAQ